MKQSIAGLVLAAVLALPGGLRLPNDFFSLPQELQDQILDQSGACGLRPLHLLRKTNRSLIEAEYVFQVESQMLAIYQYFVDITGRVPRPFSKVVVWKRKPRGPLKSHVVLFINGPCVNDVLFIKDNLWRSFEYRFLGRPA